MTINKDERGSMVLGSGEIVTGNRIQVRVACAFEMVLCVTVADVMKTPFISYIGHSSLVCKFGHIILPYILKILNMNMNMYSLQA